MATSTRTRARKQPAEVRREEIIETAMHVFAAQPYGSAGTAEIARAAGVAEPTLYRHFGSKRELYLATLARTSTQICDAWRRIVSEGHDSHMTLDLIGNWYYERAVSDADWLRLRHRAAAEAGDDDVRTCLEQGYSDVIAVLVEVIERGQRNGEISSEVDPTAAAWLFAGIGQVMDLTVLMGGDPESQLWCQSIGDLFMRSLRP